MNYFRHILSYMTFIRISPIFIYQLRFICLLIRYCRIAKLSFQNHQEFIFLIDRKSISYNYYLIISQELIFLKWEIKSCFLLIKAFIMNQNAIAIQKRQNHFADIQKMVFSNLYLYFILCQYFIILQDILLSVMFNPSQSGFYKILSALDQTKSFTVNQNRKIILDQYQAANNQKFQIFSNNGKYAFVSAEGNFGIFIEQDGSQDGSPVSADANQHKSSYFQINPVKNGQFLGLGFYIKTHCSKVIDVFQGRTQPGTPIIQWAFHGGSNQIWLVIPADENQSQQHTNAVQNQFKQLSPNFVPANTPYKIVTLLNTSKALTVSNTADHELRISDYVGDPSQKFNIYQNGNKFAFVVQSYNEGLCCFKDNKDNGGQIRTDPGQHPSSWFQVLRVQKGPFANKAYRIKTHSGQMVLDIFEFNVNNGTKVTQYNEHGGNNQIWLIVPFDQQVPKYQTPKNPQSKSLFGVNLPNINIPNLPNINLPKFF